MKAFIDLLDQLGVDYKIEADPVDGTRKSLRVSGLPAGGAYKPTNIRTQPFPGLATDLQPSAGLMLTRAAGTSTIEETIFEDRLEWLVGLRGFGAQVEIVDPRTARVTGPTTFVPAEAEIPDLRAGCHTDARGVGRTRDEAAFTARTMSAAAMRTLRRSSEVSARSSPTLAKREWRDEDWHRSR